MKFMRFRALTVSMLYLIGCSSTREINVELPKIKFGDYKSVKAPNTDIIPSFVIRVNEEGEQSKYDVADENKTYVKTSDISFPKSKSNWTQSALLDFVSSKVSVKSNRKDSVSIDLDMSDCKQESISEPDLEYLLEKLDIKWKKGSKYYIVSSVITAKKVNFSVNNWNQLSREVQASISSNSVNAELLTQKNGVSVINMNFEAPHTVLYLLKRVTKDDGVKMTGRNSVRLLPDDGLIVLLGSK